MIYRMLRDRSLPSLRIGKAKYLIPEDMLDRLFDAQNWDAREEER
jgi:hypothetical protein